MYIGLAKRFSEVLRSIHETRQWIPVLADYMGLRALPYPYNLVLRSGERLIFQEPTDTIVFWLIFVRRHYPVDSSCRVILDIGANVGMFTLYAAREAPHSKIIAVEPFPETSRKLESHVGINHLKHRVTVVNCAVTGRTGNATMDSADGIPSQYRRIQTPETAPLNAKHRGRVDESRLGVPIHTQTLGEMLDQCRIKTVDLVKMNIHGSEYDVLLSADAQVLERCHTIIVEYHTLPAAMKISKHEIFNHLEARGFRLLFDHPHRGAGCAMFSLSC